jgi:hypothetical protein
MIYHVYCAAATKGKPGIISSLIVHLAKLVGSFSWLHGISGNSIMDSSLEIFQPFFHSWKSLFTNEILLQLCRMKDPLKQSVSNWLQTL